MQPARKYYGEEYGSMKRLKEGDPRLQTLDDLYNLLRLSWSAETAYGPYQRDWIPTDPSFGQSALTAMMVHDLFGGTIHRIRNREGGTHYFNRIDGHYIDLAREQFDLYDLPVDYEPNEEINRKYCGQNPDTHRRYKKLIQNMALFIQKL